MIKKATAAALALALTICLSVGALAAQWQDFTDVSGHWAEQTMKKAFEDGLILGDDSGHINPDSPITIAEMAAILTRVLNADKKTPLEGYGVPVGVWYYEAAEKAAYLGLIDKSSAPLDAAMTRQDAFAMLSRAFSLRTAAPDLSVLSAYSDAGKISLKNKSVLADMVAAKLVEGSGGALNANGSVSRAEFLTVLYRVASNYIAEDELSSDIVGGCVVNGGGGAENVSLKGGVWYGCQTDSVNVAGESLASLTLRCNALPELDFTAPTKAGVLTIDCVEGDMYSPPDNLSVDTLRLTGVGVAYIDSWANNIEVLTDWRNIVVSGSHDSLIISGNNNKISLPFGADVDKLTVLGKGNNITVGGRAAAVNISGTGTVLGGSGKANVLNLAVRDAQVSLGADSTVESFPKVDYETAKKTVTTGYKGNFTLDWALEHDYTPEIKEAWINGRGSSSKTDYLIWVSIATQRVNIFEGSQGDWALIHTCVVGTGAPGSGTPVGVYTTTYKQSYGWTTGSYTVKPVVGFKKGTGYAFHSRLYYPGTTKIKDASIGYPISHGCVRMYEEDIAYIFQNIPVDTTVVVY